MRAGSVPGPSDTSDAAPVGVIVPTRLTAGSVNHRLPSGPAVTPAGAALLVAVANSVTTPDVVIRPTFEMPGSVNHRLPSGPAVIRAGAAAGVSPPNSTKLAPPDAPEGSSTSAMATPAPITASARAARRRDGLARSIPLVIGPGGAQLRRSVNRATTRSSAAAAH